MHFEPDTVYHVYNRGNDKQRIFFHRDHYIFFLTKIRKEWLYYTDILAYCLMPNHFHFLLMPKAIGCNYITLQERETHMQFLSKAIGKTLSSYTQAINKEQESTGNLFQRKTKAKLLEDNEGSYILRCVNYIHLNPVTANLVQHESEWEFSSYRDYCGIRNGTLCNKDLLYKVSGFISLDFRHLPSIDSKIVTKFY
jgi:putative transposase